jgi:hypothetical protein
MVQPSYTDAQVTHFWSLVLGPLFVRWAEAREADLAAWVQAGGWVQPASAVVPARLCLVWASSPTHALPYPDAEVVARIQTASVRLREAVGAPGPPVQLREVLRRAIDQFLERG